MWCECIKHISFNIGSVQRTIRPLMNILMSSEALKFQVRHRVIMSVRSVMNKKVVLILVKHHHSSINMWPKSNHVFSGSSTLGFAIFPKDVYVS